VKRLLSPPGRGVLSRIAAARTLVAFDFDGTLAPIVVNRDRALMRQQTRLLFTRLCELYPCAVVSGRARDDVAGRVAGAGVKYVVGNHGLEPGPSLESFAKDMVVVRAELQQALAQQPGIEVENKRYTLAVHYRKSRDKTAARRAIAAAVAAISIPARSIPGKQLVNLLPSAAPGKGAALLALRDRAAADVALYVGDDVTDEEVFRLGDPVRLVTARIGASKRSHAMYYLRDQLEVDQLMRQLVELRQH
jgi:trehalose 6-phosphate phosphatase